MIVNNTNLAFKYKIKIYSLNKNQLLFYIISRMQTPLNYM